MRQGVGVKETDLTCRRQWTSLVGGDGPRSLEATSTSTRAEVMPTEQVQARQRVSMLRVAATALALGFVIGVDT